MVLISLRTDLLPGPWLIPDPVSNRSCPLVRNNSMDSLGDGCLDYLAIICDFDAFFVRFWRFVGDFQ